MDKLGRVPRWMPLLSGTASVYDETGMSASMDALALGDRQSYGLREPDGYQRFVVQGSTTYFSMINVLKEFDEFCNSFHIMIWEKGKRWIQKRILLYDIIKKTNYFKYHYFKKGVFKPYSSLYYLTQ